MADAPLTDRAGVGIVQTDQPAGPVGHAAGQANPGLVQQPAGPLDGGLEGFHQRHAATSGSGPGPAAALRLRPTDACHDPAGVGKLGHGHGGDLPGHREHQLLGVTCARPHRLSDLAGAAPRRPSPIPDPGPGRTPGRLHPLAGGHQLAHRPRQQPHIGRVGHVR